MKTCKKAISVLLVTLLLLCMSITAFAADNTTNITANVPCTVSMQIGDHGKVTVDSTDYTGNSSFQKAVGAVVAYTVKPDTLYAIDKVLYDSTDVTAQLSGNTYTAPALDGNKTLQVSFTFLGIGETTSYTVTFHANGHGTAPAAQTVLEGNTATEPTAPTASGWTFGGWYKDAACTEKYIFSTAVTGDLDLYAKWTKNSGGGDPGTPDPVTYGISVIHGKAAIGMGSAITKAEAGQLITITADAPASGKVFDKWVITSDTKPTLAKDTDAVTTFTMPAGSVTIEATYKDTPVNPGGDDDDDTYYIIKATAGIGGSITPSGDVSVLEGSNKTFAISVNNGYVVDKVVVDGKDVGAVTSYTFEKVNARHEISVTFAKKTGTPGTDNPDTGTPGTDNPDTGTPGTDNPDTGTPGTGNPDTGTPGTGNPDTGTPQTGDNSNIILWLALAIAFLGTLFGIGIYGRKYRYSPKRSK